VLYSKDIMMAPLNIAVFFAFTFTLLSKATCDQDNFMGNLRRSMHSFEPQGWLTFLLHR
jgi:hypothetical protein